MVKLTLKLRLNGPASAFAALKETESVYTESFNRVCQVAYSMTRSNQTELHKLTYYPELELSKLPSQLVISARMKAYEACESVKARKKQGKKVSCPRSLNARIRFDAKSYTIKLREGKVSLSTMQGRQDFTFHVPEYAKQQIELKTCSSELIEKKKRLYLHVVLEHPIQESVDTNQAIGIDMGEVRPAVTSQNKFVGEKRWKERQERYYRQRRQLQAKGTRSAKRKLQKLSKRENGFRNDCDHVLSKRLSQMVVPGSTVVIEDLTGIRENIKGSKTIKRRLHNWSFHRFRVYLSYKCQLNGIKVEPIEPYYTSQECSRCGHIDEKNRKSQSLFECKKCKVRLNADLNAARVIEKRYKAKKGMTPPGGPPVNRPKRPSHKKKSLGGASKSKVKLSQKQIPLC
jgi:putative transposase